MPPYFEFGRNSAQIDAAAAAVFSMGPNHRIVCVRVGSSSTGARAQVLDRYPSPLKRFVLSGRPLFFAAKSFGWQDNADDAGAFRAAVRRNAASGGKLATAGADRCIAFSRSEGDLKCIRHSFSSQCLARAAFYRPVTMTRNAALWARGPVRPLLRPRGAVRLPARSLAALRACSATTRAFANNLTLNRQTDRVGVRVGVPRPFFDARHPEIFRTRGDLT